MEKTSSKKTSGDLKKNKIDQAKDSVSEIDCTMKDGQTLIHLRNTCTKHKSPTSSITEDVVNVPKCPRKMLQHGRGPVWVFQEEVNRRKIEIQQKMYLEQMKKRQKMKKLLDKREREENMNFNFINLIFFFSNYFLRDVVKERILNHFFSSLLLRFTC